MIIGHGDIANAIKDRNDLMFFASGVSNSMERRESEYQREKDLLLKQDYRNHIVYFSSLCIFYLDTRYARHKLDMETLVKKKFKKYTIIRMGNITWGTNPHTLINYLRKEKQEGRPLILQDAYRYIIEKDEFQHWLDMIPKWNCEMNITGRRMTIREVVREYVLDYHLAMMVDLLFPE